MFGDVADPSEAGQSSEIFQSEARPHPHDALHSCTCSKAPGPLALALWSPPHWCEDPRRETLWQFSKYHVHMQGTIEQLPRFRFRFWQTWYTFLPQSPSDPCQFFSQFRPNLPRGHLKPISLRATTQSPARSLRVILILPQSSAGRGRPAAFIGVRTTRRPSAFCTPPPVPRAPQRWILWTPRPSLLMSLETAHTSKSQR